MIFGFFSKKYLEPAATSLAALIRENTAAINALAERLSFQTTQISLQFEQMVKTQKRLSLQMEELYDCVSFTEPDEWDDTNSLVSAIISLCDEIGHLRDYARARQDEELICQVDLLVKICDRKLFEQGILRIARENELFDKEYDVINDVEYAPGIAQNVIIKVLSGCYKYQGEVVKRANVIICKGEGTNE